MNKEVKEKYLVLICNENGEVGNGIVVGKYLLTAGHCVGKEYTCAYTKAGQRLELTNCVAMRNEEKRDDGLFCDFAVFKVEEIESPLRLAEDNAEEGEELTSLFLEYKIESHPENIFLCNDERIAQESKAKVLQHQGNFFACEMEKALKPGNSGCPLIKDGKVYGILHGGKDGNLCIYLSTVTILNLLDQNDIEL